MAQTIHKYRIFIASPSDVKDERQAMDEVINELNLSYGNRAGVILELLKWETHAAPGISNIDSQKVFEDDIGGEYDLFVGILWKQFGTATLNFESGTQQEFINAYSKYKTDPESLNILFYFKVSGTSNINEIEPLQFLKVIEFKKSLGEKAVLYWEYDTLENLKSFLRIHIPKRIDTLLSIQENYHKIKPATTDTLKVELEEDELGLIDNQEIYEDRLHDSENALLRLAEAIRWIGDEITKKTEELNRQRAKKKELSKVEMRDFCRRTAEVMDAFASRMEPDIDLYMQNFQEGSDAFSKVLSIYKTDFKEFSKEETDLNTQVLSGLMETFSITIEQIKGFLDSISILPRMAKELNQARRNVESKVSDMVNKLEVSESITLELFKAFD